MVNKSAKNLVLAFLSIFLCVLHVQAQSHFKLYKSEGHFYFNGQMNETHVDSILLETGCRYIMCNEVFLMKSVKPPLSSPIQLNSLSLNRIGRTMLFKVFIKEESNLEIFITSIK